MGWSETALETTVRTWGTNPLTADIIKLVEPWQWITACRSGDPVWRHTSRTATGWAFTAARSRSHWLGAQAMLPLPFSTQTPYPAAPSASTRFNRVGGLKMLALTPAPCTSKTGPSGEAPSFFSRHRLHGNPSRALKRYSSKRCSTIAVPQVAFKIINAVYNV